MNKTTIYSILLSIGLITILVFVIDSSKKQHVENVNQTEISDLRDQHNSYLKNSPFTETLKLSKSERKAKGLPPNKYFEQMWELTMNPATGKTEPQNIYELQKQLKSAKRAPGDAADNPWEERGPNDVGGRTRAILFDPNDTTNKRVYAGGVSGGLWVNNDITSATSQWSRVQNVPGNLSITSITVDPRNSNTWYVGTGEQYTAGAVVGNGVYRSLDGGNSWQAVNIPAAGGGNIVTNGGNLFLSGLFHVNDILAWNNTAQNRTELFVGVGAHVYGDAASPYNWLGLQTAGLYHSIDGGTNWNRIESANMRYEYQSNQYYFIPNDLEIGADNKLWMGTINSGLGQGGGRVFSSQNGSLWTEAAASPLNDSDRVELEPSTSNANKIYALTQGITEPVHIYKSLDGFATAPTATALPNDADNGMPANDFTRGQAFYDLMIESDPNNDNIVYVGGINLFRSTNSGSGWSQISKWSNNPGLDQLSVSIVHADQHAMTFRPGNSNQAIFGNDGGIFYASNLSAASTSSVFGARVNNYNVTQYVKAGIGPNGVGDVNGIFSAGAQDNGTQAFRNTVQGINGSEQLTGGDGFYTFIDKDGEYMIATYTHNVIYRFNLPWDGLSRINGGATTLVYDTSTGDFVNQMGYDSDANILLSNASTSSSFVIKTTDVAANSNADITNASLTSKPTAFVPSPFANNTWYVGTATGGLIKLTNVGVGAATWTSINTPFVGSVSSVRLGATANDIMVTIHNYGVTSVWYSSDAGTNWVSKEGNLPDIPVRDILQNPLDASEVIVATQLGVWVSKNFNATNPSWTQSQNGMSDASVTSFDYWAINGDHTNNKIIASTYGRGVFTGSFTSNTTDPCTGVAAYDANVTYQVGDRVTFQGDLYEVNSTGAWDNLGPCGAVGGDTQAPTIPANLVASNVASTTLTLSWTASTDDVGVTGYDVYQGNTIIGTTASTTMAIESLTASTAYQFKVKAKDAAGNVSGFSNTVNITTSAPAPADPCAGVAAYDSNLTYQVGDRVVFQGDLYEVNPTGGWDNLGPCGAATGDTQAPTIPANVSASNVAETTLTLSWVASTDNVVVTGYDIYMGNTNIGSTAGTSSNINTLTANTTYQFRIKAKDAAGNESGFSSTFNVTTAAADPCAGVAPYDANVAYQVGDKVTYQGSLYENTSTGWTNIGTCGAAATSINPAWNAYLIETPESHSVYPNPVKDIMYFTTSTLSTMHYKIMNISGQVMSTGVVYNNKVDLQNLAKGIYILELNIDNNRTVEQFVKE
ncbi:fibronectin type III domain-containing protein [Aquimarina sediminis]|uniref:fibronectin type III domain-containing protein n=1 Tax=Aquimarina sediminis TaxID=2070536 RepID=UPI000CA07FB4|nr:carbohydrate-binding protein [Aquimarina sediminis]